jgi:hypothetical protein
VVQIYEPIWEALGTADLQPLEKYIFACSWRRIADARARLSGGPFPCISEFEQLYLKTAGLAVILFVEVHNFMMPNI